MAKGAVSKGTTPWLPMIGDDPAAIVDAFMAWTLLFIAGLLEVGWAVGLKYTAGFTRLWPSVWSGVAMVASLWLLSIALRSLPLGTAYAVWVGIGAVGTVVLGIVLFDEPATRLRLASTILILVGIAGLKLATPA